MARKTFHLFLAGLNLSTTNILSTKDALLGLARPAFCEVKIHSHNAVVTYSDGLRGLIFVEAFISPLLTGPTP